MTSVLPPLTIEPAATMQNTALVPPKKKKAAFPLSNWGGVQTMVTSYSMDFGKKESTPSEPRPCSATRRNRPHPSQWFMNWRLPSGPILNRNNGSITEPNESAEYKHILQNFCEEYRGKDEPKRNVQSPNICKETIVDEKLKLMETLKISGKPVETFQLPVAQLNPEALSIVADLLKKATPQEQEVLHKVFGTKDFSQELPSYSFISPEAISVLEQILQKAGITDSDAAIRFLLSIGQIIMSISYPNGQTTPRARTTAEERERTHALRSPPIRSPHFRVAQHGDGACALCSKSSLTNELQNMSDKKVAEKVKISSYLENVPRLPKLRPPCRRTMLARQKPWHNLPSYPPQGKVENKLATFVMPHRPIPRSFTIHPEWD